jgi:hypothetical protein
MKASTPVGEETFDDVEATEEAIPWQDVVLPLLAVVTLIGVGLLGTAMVNAFHRRPLGNAQVTIQNQQRNAR